MCGLGMNVVECRELSKYSTVAREQGESFIVIILVYFLFVWLILAWHLSYMLVVILVLYGNILFV